MQFTSLRDVDVKGKVVLLRADLNVPAKNGQVTDTTRIDRLSDTINYLSENGAKTVVLSHFGRPKGAPEAEFSLAFLVPVLERQWNCDIAFASDCIGPTAQKAIESLAPGGVLLLENVRFHKGEEANDPSFVRELSRLGDVYVNDAFSAAHRAHASTEGLAHLLPSAAGFLMEAELTALTKALEKPEKPVAAIVGGAKISTKLSVLNNLVQKVDYLILGGGMANTFLFSRGVEVGKSLCEKDMAEEARAISATAEKAGCRIVLPVDRVCVRDFGPNAAFEIHPVASMPADMESVDVGPATLTSVGQLLETCRTVLWNGPLGVFEVKPFDAGTNGLARIVADLTKKGQLLSVAGGGDTVSALENAGAAQGFSYVSSAGGAFLEWMEGKDLPGVSALSAARKNAA